MSETSARVLMTCVGGALAPDLLLHLRAETPGITALVGVDASGCAAGKEYLDAFYEAPFGDAPGYLDAIVDVVRRERINVIMPGSDQEAFALAAAAERLASSGASLLTSPAPVLELIRDKEATYRTLEAARIRVPRRRIVFDAAGLVAALKEYGYPSKCVITKPTAGRGGRGLRVLVGQNDSLDPWIGTGQREKRFEAAVTENEMKGWFDDGPLMVMSALGSPAYDVDILAVRGKARHAIVRERKNPAGIPFTGNFVVPDAGIRDYCLAIAEAVGLDGLHDIDLMTDSDGNPALLEINPRMSGSISAAHAAGFPIASAAIAAAVGRPFDLPSVSHRIEVNLLSRAVSTRNRSEAR